VAVAEDANPVSAAEIKALFADLVPLPCLVLAISGGPDSTALLVLAARWRTSLKTGPKLVAVTVDHGLRPESAREAKAAGRLARKLKVPHRTLPWTGRKPKSGLQAAARLARYRLLAKAAAQVGARHILTAHTRDDQAETLLIRLTRGSGLAGLAGMARISPVPAGGDGLLLMRPLLDLPKARLLATLKAARIEFADDSSNRDPRFTRVRIRALLSAFEREDLSAARLSVLARRLARANAAIEHATGVAYEALQAKKPISDQAPLEFDAAAFRRLPEEVALRLLGRAIAERGNEGIAELGKLETLCAAVYAAPAAPVRRTLAGALVTLKGNILLVERAPPRRTGQKLPLTKRKGGGIKLRPKSPKPDSGALE
jgi:tRNA(Ile)-lysidine synthase